MRPLAQLLIRFVYENELTDSDPVGPGTRSADWRIMAVIWFRPPRIQAFEFCDQPWLRGIWREAYLDCLNLILRAGGVYRRVCGPLARWAQKAGHAQVLDLASGGGGSAATLMAEAGRTGARVPRLILSDLHPDIEAFDRLARSFPGKVTYIDRPVDASEPVGTGARLFSIFGALHHLPPAAVQKLLRKVSSCGDGIFVQEVFDRNWLGPLLCVFNLPLLMLAPFLSGRFSLRKLLLCTVLPLVPLMVIFDGVVSVLRSYTPAEITAMLPDEVRRDWHWESGRCRFLFFFGAPYMCGRRRPCPTGTGPSTSGTRARRSRELRPLPGLRRSPGRAASRQAVSLRANPGPSPLSTSASCLRTGRSVLRFK